MAGIGEINLKVVIMDDDYYAMQAINSYLAWDRRTRVTYMTTELDDYWDYLQLAPLAELPDVIILDVDHLGDDEALTYTLQQTRAIAPDAHIIAMAQRADLKRAELVAQQQVRAYFLKQDVQVQLAWAIIFAIEQNFTLTRSMTRLANQSSIPRVFKSVILPQQREFPEMTDRIRQAIRLCVIEGMPAHLAADEMGISLHTIRGYIKEGYRILETHDAHEYPTDMTPQERAFMRFTALSVPRRKSDQQSEL